MYIVTCPQKTKLHASILQAITKDAKAEGLPYLLVCPSRQQIILAHAS